VVSLGSHRRTTERLHPLPLSFGEDLAGAAATSSVYQVFLLLLYAAAGGFWVGLEELPGLACVDSTPPG